MSGERTVVFFVGINFRSFGLPRVDLPTVYMPWRGEYWPESRQARVGAQLGALA